jgi:carnitine O-acetyltransferase
MKGTFEYQERLPIMPVPDLEVTCNKFIEWVSPLLNKDDLERAQKSVAKFLLPDGQGKTLQRELISWSEKEKYANWSAPVWKELYLAARDSLVINHNVFYYLKSKLDTRSHTQAQIATALVVCAAEFMNLIDRAELSVDMQKASPQCMNQYNNLFSATRVPHPGVDELKVTAERQHIVVLHKGHIFRINILDEAGAIRNAADIEAELDFILTTQEHGDNLGLLTTQDRESWAANRVALLSLSEDNRAAMTDVENAAFILCLDSNSPDSLQETSKMLLHGDGYDRFFDKALQFIVFQNGKSGINFEHSGVDGSVMLRLIGYIYNNIERVSFSGHSKKLTAEEIKVNLNRGLLDSLYKAKELFNEHIANTQTRVLNFSDFGKELIKTFNISPDAFVQLALQLAEYKLYGQCYSAYEAIMTRGFLDGRIDVLYTVSPESMTFIRNMQDKHCSDQERVASLMSAVKTHLQRANECRTGNGIYTHFLGLESRYKAVGDKLGMQKPDLFSDKGYQALFNSVVCTSTTSEYGVELAGYGPIVDDGYGIRYFKRKHAICFNLTSRSAMQDKLDQMCAYIEESLQQMADLMRRSGC